jgi:transcriptional regulator with XRE-family HTH domain
MSGESNILTEEVIYQPALRLGGQLMFPNLARQGLLLSVALSIAMPSGIVSARDLQHLASKSHFSSQGGIEPLIRATPSPVPVATPMLAEICETLTLTTTQTAKAVNVSRQRIYDYRNGQQASPETISRLQVLSRIAQHWQSLDSGSLSGKIALPFADGTSLLDLLSAPEIDEAEVCDRLAMVASFQRGEGPSPFAPRPTVVKELRALGVSEPTEEERHLRREDARIRRMLRRG